MILQAKWRVEQIKNGKIPTGYKKTEFGIFPCDWETDKTFGDLFDFYGGLGKTREELGEKGHAYLHYGDLHRGAYNVVSHQQYERLPKCDVHLKGNESYLMQDGDVAFLDASEDLEGTSRSVLIDNPENKPFIAGLHIIYGKPKDQSLDKWFKQYITSTDCVKKQFHHLAVGFKVYGLNRETLPKIRLAFPKSLSEQAKIAEILITWDKAIELYKKQIEKLKQFKKICLKKMFPAKGQTVPEWRFKGFTGEWERQRIDDLIKKGGSGGTPSTSHPEYYSGTIPFLSIADISNSNGNIFNTEKHITEEAVCASSAWIVPSGSISLAMYASVGKVAILKDNVATSQAFFNMILSEDSTRDYLYYYLKKMDEFGEWTPYISTGTQGNLNSETVRNLCVSIPKETTERRIIGNILNHIDSCITLYQRKLETEQKRRKALMQLLLSGIVRV